MLLHLLATIAGVAVIFVAPLPLAGRLAVALVLQLVVPALSVAFRLVRQRRIVSVLPGLFLYWLYFVARLRALAIIVTGQSRRYRKIAPGWAECDGVADPNGPASPSRIP